MRRPTARNGVVLHYPCAWPIAASAHVGCWESVALQADTHWTQLSRSLAPAVPSAWYLSAHRHTWGHVSFLTPLRRRDPAVCLWWHSRAMWSRLSTALLYFGPESGFLICGRPHSDSGKLRISAVCPVFTAHCSCSRRSRWCLLSSFKPVSSSQDSVYKSIHTGVPLFSINHLMWTSNLVSVKLPSHLSMRRSTAARSPANTRNTLCSFLSKFWSSSDGKLGYAVFVQARNSSLCPPSPCRPRRLGKWLCLDGKARPRKSTQSSCTRFVGAAASKSCQCTTSHSRSQEAAASFRQESGFLLPTSSRSHS